MRVLPHERMRLNISHEGMMREDELITLLGKNMAARRRKAGMTQENLAEILKIAPDTMSRMEKGRFAPKMSRLRDMADALNCSVADLFRDADENAADRASTIAEILKPLPDEAQEALVELMAHAARVMKKRIAECGVARGLRGEARETPERNPARAEGRTAQERRLRTVILPCREALFSFCPRADVVSWHSVRFCGCGWRGE